ncbi:MAG: hypothetical protein F4X18_03890 [Acidimicrobiia bacterium]|nr:hypothetical protein [Acidimicrobiia bacterium]
MLNRVETIPDGGVDAEVTDAPAGGEWIPEGDSVWQFKRSNLYPKDCAEEFGRATWAQQKVRAGSAYVMVLGVSLSPKLLERRRVAILKKAEELGLDIGGDHLDVRDANALARWMSLYPSLAVSGVMGGPGSSAVDFATWADSRLGRTKWVPDEGREEAIQTIRSALSQEVGLDLRVGGASGVGKSRLVLEALREQEIAPLVAYVADEAKSQDRLLRHLVADHRKTAVLVVDECPADRHATIADQLPADGRIRLITIGPIGSAVTRSPVVVVEPMRSEAIDKFASKNFPGLSNVDRRFVVENSDGYPQLAEVFARRVLDSATPLQAADLVTETEIRQFITDRHPGSLGLRVARGVALFEKLGWEDEVSGERERLARFLRMSDSALQSAGWELEEAGWLAVRGRYRAIAAHRLAVFLASRKWEGDGDRIVSELLDNLDDQMAFAMFRRLADLGRYEPAQTALVPVLTPDGPFGSLEKLRTSGRAARLTQLAIILPNDVALYLHELLEDTPEDELRCQPAVCHELAWTLEMLAWHTDTFRLAAGLLLRLALAEFATVVDADSEFMHVFSESHSTSRWISLFGTMLPATAATPETRMQYLKEVTRSEDVRERALAVMALRKAISVSEWVMAAGESQGGASVEPRGTPQTWDEAWAYQISAINELSRLVGDPSPQVRSSVEDSLIDAIDPLSASGVTWEALENVLIRTPSLHSRVRHRLQSLEPLYDRADRIDESEEGKQRRQQAMEALDSLKGRLPSQDSRDTLELALKLPRWHHPDRIERTVVDAMAGFLSDHDEACLFEFLSRKQPNAGEFGVGLALLPLQLDPTEALVNAYEQNAGALLGYLHRKAETDRCAVETFLDDGLGGSMSEVAQLEIAQVGPQTERIHEVIDELVDLLSVADSAVRVRVAARDYPKMLERWLVRLETQDDYNALVRTVSDVWLNDETCLESITDRLMKLVLLRRDFPKLGQDAWNWGHLAKAVLDGHEEALAEMVLDMIENSGRVVTLGSAEVAEVLRLALRQSTEKVWRRIGERLETGSSRLMHIAEYWCVLEGVEPSPIQAWIGNDANRARLVARVARLGSDEPTPMARYLLATFGDDEQITSIFDLKLDGELQEGNRSSHLQRQIDRLDSWRQDREEPMEVQRWASTAIARLKRSKKKALREEEERG